MRATGRITLGLFLMASFGYAQQFVISTIAGGNGQGLSGDGGPAGRAQLNLPLRIVADSQDNLYVIDYGNGRIRKIARGSGTITTVAGDKNGSPCCDATATRTVLGNVQYIAVGPQGDLYLAVVDGSHVLRVTSQGAISVFAGIPGNPGFSGDGGLATKAQISQPGGLAVDRSGNLYVADSGNHRIRKVSTDGVIRTSAGDGTVGSSGDGGPATSAQMSGPTYMAFDSTGNLYVADSPNIRKISPDGIITTAVTAPSASVVQTFSQMAVDSAGAIYTVDLAARVLKIQSSINGWTVVAGTGQAGYAGDGGLASAATLSRPSGITLDSNGNLYVADQENHAIRLLQPVPSSPTVNGIQNAASNLVGAMAPGEIVVLYGSGLGPKQLTQCQANNLGNIDTQCSGTTVSFNGALAPIIYTWTTQVAAIVPYSVSDRAIAQATVTYQGQTSDPMTLYVESVAPGIFTLDSTGKGQAAAVNLDGSINTPGHPIPIGSFISLYATGEGQTSPAGVDGKPAAVPLPHPFLPVTVTIGGQLVIPQYAGGAPGEVAGVMQVNVRIPDGIQPGDAIPVTVHVGNGSSQTGVTIAVTGK